jgi:hypothetical protein
VMILFVESRFPSISVSALESQFLAAHVMATFTKVEADGAVGSLGPILDDLMSPVTPVLRTNCCATGIVLTALSLFECM